MWQQSLSVWRDAGLEWQRPAGWAAADVNQQRTEPIPVVPAAMPTDAGLAAPPSGEPAGQAGQLRGDAGQLRGDAGQPVGVPGSSVGVPANSVKAPGQSAVAPGNSGAPGSSPDPATRTSGGAAVRSWSVPLPA